MGISIEKLTEREFDYVIIGGGLCGLTLGARLAEDTTKTVIVLEAGPENLNDTLINLPGHYGLHAGDPKYDWLLRTTQQQGANNRDFAFVRGKTLGGSSALHYLAWQRPPAKDVDNWEKLGNPGWNWNNFLEASKRTESFMPPAQEEHERVYNKDVHGTNGPLKTTFPSFVNANDKHWIDALKSLGIPIAKNPLGGDPIGISTFMTTLDPVEYTRSYSANAFYNPSEKKSNFVVVCESTASRIVTRRVDDSLLGAEGVEFLLDGASHIVHARREVIVCAGALKSPQILELSGIGDPRILAPLGIETKVRLPGVGANMQEHQTIISVYELDPDVEYQSFDKLRDKEFANTHSQMLGDRHNLFNIFCYGLSFVPLSMIVSPSQATTLIEAQKSKISKKIETGEIDIALAEQYLLQLESLERGDGGECEFMLWPSCFSPDLVPSLDKTYVSTLCFLERPFSRGTVHINSSDPQKPPEIDPHYFEDEFDLEVMVEMTKFARKLSETEPFKSMILKEVIPGTSCKTHEEIREFVKNFCQSSLHTVGTLSMLPREKNGVVDGSLRVYGTKNIRVVDLSVVPLQISAHTQATAYAIAERAADIIKREADFNGARN